MKLDVKAAGMNGNGHVAQMDLETGELRCPRCEHLRVGDYELLEEEVRKLRRKVKALERDRIEDRLRHVEREKVLKVIDYWKRLTGHPKANKQAADRFDYVVARRSELYPFGDPVEDPPEEPCPTICLAIEGLAAYPYATKEGRRSNRQEERSL